MVIALIESDNTCTTLLKDFIVHYFRNFMGELSIYSFPDSDSFFQTFSKNIYTFIFLSMDIPHTPNLVAAEYIRTVDQSVNLILTSHSTDYAIEGYTVQANYYLLKPFTYSNVETALSLCPTPTVTLRPFIEVVVNRISTLIFVDDIMYVDTIHNGIQIHTTSDTLKTYMSFKQFLKLVKEEACFLQCYRGIVVNMDYIHTLQNDSFLLYNEEVIPIRLPDRCFLRDTYRAYTLQKHLHVPQEVTIF
ncbi:LytR/AlgR family response regulator transcription factor [Niameybacter massiliensis]|uniref:LytR/AlgR family response regulator transcription factor n=1 Tax=Niameybacter massiliensis TaxID=1658108 RepID=UPI0006B6585B|nr:LytTR family transcriptional regulator DNA-binding domain-containing protein [Niameybacter massiliensis]